MNAIQTLKVFYQLLTGVHLVTSSSVDGSWNLNEKYQIIKPANQVFGLIMERLHHLEGFVLC